MLSTTHDLNGLPDPVVDRQFYQGVPFKRLIAWFIDFIIITLIAAALVLVSFGAGAFIFPMLLFFTNIAYRIFTLSRNSATLGMIVTGVEIRNRFGNKLNLTEAAWHTGLYTGLSLLFFTLVISMVMMLVNARGQGLHDYFLGTTAINRPKP
ncbi:MAG: RDD family protein [Proteobacteria bacterium]|nr:RDD family protein [Pseudomonadota bacterium]